MNKNTTTFLGTVQNRVVNIFERLLPSVLQKTTHDLYEAIRYAVFNGGKRIRPALVYATGKALGATYEQLDTAAASIELLHCYSLIHDDLPSLDNSELRRGRLSCHKVFNEATAILVGDALQSLAFEILSHEKMNTISPAIQVTMVQVLSKAAGANGMVLGQAEDLAGENFQLSLSELEQQHQRKTGALFQAAVHFGALAAHCHSCIDINKLIKYGRCIGLVFQICDDILDVLSDTKRLGKPAKSDNFQHKSTFPTLIGLEKAKVLATILYKEGLKHLSKFGTDANCLRELSFYIIDRKY